MSSSGVEDAGSKPYNAQRPQSQAIFRRVRKIAVSEKTSPRHAPLQPIEPSGPHTLRANFIPLKVKDYCASSSATLEEPL